MKTTQVYYIIIVILIVIILFQLFKNSNENFVCPQPTYKNAETNEYKKYKSCDSNLSCAKKYLLPALDEFESAYKKNTTDQHILGLINNNVTCETNFLNNNLSLSDARQELNTCLNNYTKCDSKCKQEMYAMQDKYLDIQNAVNNFNNSPAFGECINNY